MLNMAATDSSASETEDPELHEYLPLPVPEEPPVVMH
jgi:hypothetical protein